MKLVRTILGSGVHSVLVAAKKNGQRFAPCFHVSARNRPTLAVPEIGSGLIHPLIRSDPLGPFLVQRVRAFVGKLLSADNIRNQRKRRVL